jgi:beta-lactamase class A
MTSRRRFVALTAAVLPGLLRAAPRRLMALQSTLARLEQVNGGRLGVAVIDTATGEHTGHRGDERFPMCSTFKFLLASAVLQRVDQHQEHLDRAIAVPAEPLLSHSPLTQPHAGGAMMVADLCHAVLNQSDNTAANLLLATIGGPPGITRFARSIGDTVTRLDRSEPDLNEARDHDPRDSTSPVAMAGDLQKILLGTVLMPDSRNQMVQWMQGSLTGLDRLRAKLPTSWRAADKTGTSGTHTSNDIAVFWPEGTAPIIVTAYITQCTGPEAKRAAMLAQIGELVMESLR